MSTGPESVHVIIESSMGNKIIAASLNISVSESPLTEVFYTNNLLEHEYQLKRCGKVGRKLVSLLSEIDGVTLIRIIPPCNIIIRFDIRVVRDDIEQQVFNYLGKALDKKYIKVKRKEMFGSRFSRLLTDIRNVFIPTYFAVVDDSEKIGL